MAQKESAKTLDIDPDIADNKRMNDEQIITAARRLARANQTNKWRIAAKRARSARIKATMQNLPKPTKFNEPYKYG